MSSPTPRAVSRFEANLLRILRFFLKQVPAEQALRLIYDRMDRPPCLTADALYLIRDSLSKGCVLYLVRAGGWKRDRFLRGGEPKFGRLWERSGVADLTLRFSKHVVDFVMWLTASRRDDRPIWEPDRGTLTPADQLLMYLAYEAGRVDPELALAWRQSPAFHDNGLIWLAFPNDFAGEAHQVPPMDVWFTEPGSFILEALQPVLEQRWLDIERSKGLVGDWAKLGQQGEVQGRVLTTLTQAVDAAQRRDLVRFLLAVMARVLATPDLGPTFWTGGLQGAGPGRLAERLAIQRNALSVLRVSERLRTWTQAARASGYMDEDYAVSKFWLAEWERYDLGTIVERAERILQQVEPLRLGGE